MAIRIISQEIIPELTNQPTTHLLGNVIDKIRIKTELAVSNSVITDPSKPIIVNYTTGVIPTAPGNHWLYDAMGRFQDFHVGDTFLRWDYINNAAAGSGTITAKLDNYRVEVDTDFGTSADQAAVTTVFNITTPITSMKYFYNFIENDEPINFTSKVNGATQMLEANDIDASDTVTVVPMVFVGPKPYQIGAATIKGTGINTTNLYEFKFEITFDTFITPFVLAEQWADLLARNPVPYFLDDNCIKYVWKFLAEYQYNDPNRSIVHQSSADINYNLLGNTGWFNENFNTASTNFTVGSVSYVDAGAVQVSGVVYTNLATTITFPVVNTIDNPFSNNNTNFVVSVMRVPFDVSEYNSPTNPDNLTANFIFDRALQTVGSAAVNGDNFGTGYQMITGLTAAFSSSAQIDVTFKVQMGADALLQILRSEEYRYIIAISIQNHTLDTNSADKVTLLVDANNFFVDLTDPNLLVLDTAGFKFLGFPHDDFDAYGVQNIKYFIEDEATTRMEFIYDKSGLTGSDVTNIQRVDSYIVAKNGPTEFILDQQGADVSAYPIDFTGAQAINDSTPRVFHIPAAEVNRKYYQVNRRPDLDSTDIYGYEIIYPWMIRWETWLAQPGVPGVFFLNTQPNNNMNREWTHYDNIGYKLYCRTVVTVIKNGIPLQYKYDKVFDMFSYTTPSTIKTYNSLGVEQTNPVSGDKYILDTEDTLVEATFTLSGPPDLANCAVQLGVEVYQQGGSAAGSDGKRRMNSVNPSDADTWFKPLVTVGSNKVELTASGNDLIARAYIDMNAIPANSEFSLSARLFGNV